MFEQTCFLRWPVVKWLLSSSNKASQPTHTESDYLALSVLPPVNLCFCACVSCLCVVVYPSVCGSLYELVTGLPESEMPYHFYTDQRFALVLLCILLILPLSISKEISIQKYIRSVFDLNWILACVWLWYKRQTGFWWTLSLWWSSTISSLTRELNS